MGRGDFDSTTKQFQNNWPASKKWLDIVEEDSLLTGRDAAPHYGEHQRQRRKSKRDELVRTGEISDECCCKMDDISGREGVVTPMKLESLVGDRNQRVRQHSDLSRKEQVVAVIVE